MPSKNHGLTRLWFVRPLSNISTCISGVRGTKCKDGIDCCGYGSEGKGNCVTFKGERMGECADGAFGSRCGGDKECNSGKCRDVNNGAAAYCLDDLSACLSGKSDTERGKSCLGTCNQCQCCIREYCVINGGYNPYHILFSF